MGGFVNPEGKTVTCEEFWRAFVRDPEKLKRKVSYKEIVDKGNASMLAKRIVCFQGVWFLIQLMGRAIAHKTIALLELHVAIHILIAAGIYVLWWNKSLDVNEPIVLDVTYVPSYESWDDNNQDGFAPWWMMPTLDTHPDRNGTSKVQIAEKKVHGEKKVQKNGEKNGAMIMPSRARREVNMRSITTCLFYICYAGLHSTAWNAYFPTDTEKWIWRGSCLVVRIVPALLLLFYVIVIIIQEYDHDPEALRKSQVAMGIILGMIYLAAAGALLIEAFISLRMADPEIYQKVPVSVYLPHF
ncbi:hypothetical protein DFP73DRAFT_510128 [Morchella snyderi]|nr:hypothetical protein DFP73DRAFT_510128 [Morchella snyderi]